MKILFVQKNFHPNTVGQFDGLIGRGHEVFAVMQYVEGVKSGASSSTVRPERVGYGRVSHLLWRNQKKRLDMRGFPQLVPLARVLRRVQPDVVIVKETRTVSFVAGVVARALGARVILSWEKPKLARKSWKLALLGWILLPKRKFHMGHLGEVGRDIGLGGLLGRSRLLPYPVEPHPSARKQASTNGPVKIVAISSLDNRRKRLSWLTEAVNLADLNEEVEISYIGLGNEKSFFYGEIRRIESCHGLSESQILLDLPHRKVLDLLPSFDLLVLPARNEPFGAVIPEAMASGLPVICSSTCGSRICFVDGVSGIVFPSDSLDACAAAVARLVRDPALRDRMGAEAYRRMDEVLKPSRWAEMFEELLEDRPNLDVSG